MGERRWRVQVLRRPQKVLRRLPKNLLQRIREAIWSLADDPRPPGCVKLVGYDNLYRLRVGDWRIIYAVEDDQLIILVIEIAPRGGVYERLTR
ncbi:MAG TPA: type II toxin-antitoxin system RelE/ParE family toxin [Anaerolineae bacterium]|nr:type II toxin-antitoxin system RelE/ParE family toxin [Anaerolineae bacterium]